MPYSVPVLFSAFWNRIKQLFQTETLRSREDETASRNVSSTVSSAGKPSSARPKAADLAANLQREIRAERKFSLAEAIGREGGSFMKGESAIPRPLRAKTAINQFIVRHLRDPTSALSSTLQAWSNRDIRVSRQLDTPLVALQQIIESLIAEPTTFCEFARQVAIAHASITGERPHFQQPNSLPHPEAAYTHDAIQAELSTLLQILQTLHRQPV